MFIINIEIYMNNYYNNDYFELPIHYNYHIQSSIYNSIDPELAEFLHQKGYITGSRAFKFFTFSRMLGLYKIDKEKDKIFFLGETKLVISSPFEEFCQSLVNTLLTRGTMRINNAKLKIIKINARKVRIDSENIIIKSLSPIVTYSTFLRPDGRKYTCYFQPGDPDYIPLISNNLAKKYQAYYNKQPQQSSFGIKPLGKQKLNLINYKGTIIKGYSGKLQLTGPKQLLQIAVDCGLGSKNSQGFGCIELIEQK